MTPLLRRLILGRTVASLATSLIPTTLTLAVVRAGGTAGGLGLVLAAEMVPMLLLLPVAGVFADRFPPRRVVLVADLTRAAAQAATGAALLTGPVRIAVLAPLAAVTGAAVAFGSPAVRKLVRATVAGPEQVRLNARLSIWQGIAQFAGPGVAGALMLGLGPGWSSLLTAVLFAGSALTLGGLRTAIASESVRAVDAAQASEPAPSAARTGFLTEFREGWAETRRHKWFVANVLGHGTWHFTAGFLLTLGPVLVGGGTAWVVILQSGTLGLLCGVWASRRLRIRRPLVAVAIGSSAYALPLGAFAAVLPLPLIVGAYFAAMFGLGVLDPWWETTIQQRIPAGALGRVGSFDTLISYAARPLGLTLAAPVAAAVGPALPLAVGAVLVGAVNLSVLRLAEVRDRPRGAAFATA